MAVPLPRNALIGLLAIGSLASCTIETDKVTPIDDSRTSGDSGGTTDCDVPVANAGEDQSVTLGATVSVDGSGSTVCKTAGYGYSWSFEAVPTDSTVSEESLSANDSPEAVAVAFTPDVPGDYVLSLKVSDGTYTSAKDLVVITVTAEDAPPVADCGRNIAGQIGERATLDGSSSYDPEGASLTYAWSLSSVPTCSVLESRDLYDDATATPSVVPDCEGIYVLSLVVSDGFQWSEPDLCYVDVSSDNRLPVADAGASAELSPCIDATIQLDAYGSYDLDGDGLTYQWSLVSAPGSSSASDADFSDSTDPVATFHLPDDPVVAGDYTFQLQVFDGADWSAPDIVTYTVQSESVDSPPVANAGDDQSVDAEADCTVGLSYSASCEDCEGADISLDGTASYDADGDDLTFKWTEPTSTMDIALSTAPATNATVPGVTAEYRTDVTVTYDVTLTVTDGCDATGSDTMRVTYTCTGTKSTTSF